MSVKYCTVNFGDPKMSKTHKLCPPAEISKNLIHFCIENGIAVRMLFDVEDEPHPIEYTFQRDSRERVKVYHKDDDDNTTSEWQWREDMVRRVYVPLYGGPLSYTDMYNIHGKKIPWSEFLEKYVESASKCYAAPYWDGPYENPPLTSVQRALMQAKANNVAHGIRKNVTTYGLAR